MSSVFKIAYIILMRICLTLERDVPVSRMPIFILHKTEHKFRYIKQTKKHKQQFFFLFPVDGLMP